VSTQNLIVFGVRFSLVALFLPFSALDKVLNFRGALAQAHEVFRPRPLAILVLLGGLAIEVLMSLAILLGIADRLAALVMAAYCAATAVLFKRFWVPGDWSNPSGNARGLFWDFLKNLSLGAGFLLITAGLDGTGWTAFRARPLASTHPYDRGAELRPEVQ
jgi:putative oxidoreductase